MQADGYCEWRLGGEVMKKEGRKEGRGLVCGAGNFWVLGPRKMKKN